MSDISPRDSRPIADQLESDLYSFLSQAEESFECLIFKARMETEGQDTDNIEEVGTLEHSETKISYQSFIKTNAVELPGDLESRSIIASGGYSDGETDGTTMVFEDPAVPEQSIVLVKEIISNGNDEKVITTMYYVLRILPVGKHGAAGKKHILIAFRGSFEDLLDADNDGYLQPEEVGDLDGFVGIE